MSLTYQIDPLLPPFKNGAVFSMPGRTPSMKSDTTTLSQEPLSFEVLFFGTNVSPQWEQEVELVLQRLMLCQGITTQRCAAWVCDQAQICFAPSLVHQRDQDRAHKGLHPPLLHIPETEAILMLTRFINQAILHLMQEIMTREHEAAAGLFSLQTLMGKRRLLSLLQATAEKLGEQGTSNKQAL